MAGKGKKEKRGKGGCKALFGLVLASLLFAGSAFAYDVTYQWKHSAPADVKEFRIKRGTVKGGPYGTTVSAGKPTPNGSGVYSFSEKGLSGSICAVATAIANDGSESPPSNEACTVPAPTAVSITIVYDAGGATTITQPVQ